MIVTFRVHPHRANFDLVGQPPNGLPKQYLHVSSWGAEPRQFFEVVINVPDRTVFDLKGCGCASHVAHAWMEGTVDLADITWDAGFRVVTIGKHPKGTKKK